jgi:uncharacterized protein (DUF433 family)
LSYFSQGREAGANNGKYSMITRKLHQTIQFLISLSIEEKIEIQRLLDGIAKTSRCCNGSARIKNTTIPVWSLWQSRQMGATDAEILEAHPVLTPIDLSNAWTYAETFPDEIEQAIAANEMFKLYAFKIELHTASRSASP